MNENVSFYICPICGNVIGLIDGDINHIKCCGKPMEQMIANSTDAATEKHVPVWEIIDDEIVVKVGEAPHPMKKDHYIMWIAQVSDNRTTRVRLFPEQSTETRFPYMKNCAIYAYCNKHGLWKTEIK